MIESGDVESAIRQVRDALGDDPREARGLIELIGSRGPGGLRAWAAALAVLYEEIGEPWMATTAWILARDEIEIDLGHRDDPMSGIARREIARLGGAHVVGISASVRSVAREDLVSGFRASGLARQLSRGHENLGGSLLGNVEFPDGDTGVACSVLGWLAPMVERARGGLVVDTTVVLLGLADRDAGVAAAMHANGCAEAMEAELREKSWERVPWSPAIGDMRVVATGVHRPPDEPGKSPGPVTVAEWGRSEEEPVVVIGRADGAIAVWHPIRAHAAGPTMTQRNVPTSGREFPVLGAVLDEQLAIATADGAFFAGGGGGLLRVEIDAQSTRAICAAGTDDDGAAVAVASDRSVTLHALHRRGEQIAELTIALADTAEEPSAISHLVAGRDGDEAVIIAVTDRVTTWWPRRQAQSSLWPLLPVSAIGTGDRGGRGVIALATGMLPTGTSRVEILDTRTGVNLGGLDMPGRVTDLSCGVLAGRDLLSIVDGDGQVEVWDIGDLMPVTIGTRRIATGVATCRFGAIGNGPAVLTRTTSGTVEVHEIALASLAEQVPDFHSDDVTDVRLREPRGDPLDREGEAEAIAQVLISTRVRPPLAIGLFGEWGEGKSYFMQRIQYYVQRRSGGPAVGGEGVCRNVRQVRFNAWQYSETDLWAGLVSHLFDQLATTEAPGDAGRVEQRGLTLLRTEIVRQRHVRERLDQARALRDRYARELRALENPANLREYSELSTDEQAALRAIAGDDAEVVYNAVRSSWGLGARLVAAIKGAGRALRRRRWLLATVGAAIALAVISALLALSVDAVRGAGAVAAAGSIAAACLAIAPSAMRAAHQVNELRASVLERAREMDTRIGHMRVRRDVAAAEASDLGDEYERTLSAGQLAGVLEARLKDGTYRSRLGLMSSISDDLRRMAELLASSSAVRGSGPSDPELRELPVIDRIVLYIDDLDRCPPRRVVEVLEAIQLLLAVNLFVVVVAVDPRWLLRSLSAHYREILATPARPDLLDVASQDAADEAIAPSSHESVDELWLSTPMHYLEKIFQIPFTIAPLDRRRYEQYVDSLITPAGSSAAMDGESGSGATSAADADAAVPPQVSDPMRAESTTSTTVESTRAGAGPALRPVPVPKLPPPPTAQLVDPLVLHEDEVRFLKLLGPPLVTTPRSAKRLLNSYGLLLAIEGQTGREAMVATTVEGRDVRPHRAALTLLAAVTGCPDDAPNFFRRLFETANSSPELDWTQFLAQRNGADTSLVKALIDLTRRAEASDEPMPLPNHLRDWTPWVIPCGRLSFQTGHVVVHLDTDDTG